MPTETSDRQQRALGFAACAGASVFWGCGFFFGKIALAEMNVGAMVLYRFAFATLVLLPLIATNRPGLNAREWRKLLCATFLGIPLQFLLQFHGLTLTTVSHASLMVGTMPVILALGATIFTNERLRPLGWVALAASTIGAALIAFSHDSRHTAQGPSIAGDMYVVASMAIALFWILWNKSLLEKHSAVVITAYGLASGTLMLAVIVPVTYGIPPVHGVSWKAWAALAASGVLCTAITTLLWNWGMKKVPASQAGILLNAEPLMGSVLGVFVLHEQLGASAWVGGGLIIAAAITLTTQRQAAPPDPAIV